MISNNLLPRLTQYAEEIIRDYQYGIRRKGSTTDLIFCILQTLEKNWENNESVHRLFIDFRKAYDLVKREVLYNIIVQFCIPMKVLSLIKMLLTETCSRVLVG
jgi:hypothetical protein